MQFLKRLRQPVRDGEITTSIRVWKQPRVRAGGRYRMEEGFVRVVQLREITFEEVSPTLARESGFGSVGELMRTAQHGDGHRMYLVEFTYEEA